MSGSDVEFGDGDVSTSLFMNPPTPDTFASHVQGTAWKDGQCKDGGESVDASGGDGDGLTTPRKRKSLTPEDMAHSQDEATGASDIHDEQGPVTKKPRLDADTEPDASDTLVESSPEKNMEPGASNQPEIHMGDEEEAAIAENPRLDTNTETEASNAQGEFLPKVKLEAGASNQPDHHAVNDEEETPIAKETVLNGNMETEASNTQRESSTETQVAACPSNQPENHNVAAAEEEEEEAPAKPPKPEPKKCGICHNQLGKYKCPRCPIAYCSVACNKIHKENHPPPLAPPPPKPTAQTTNTSHQNQSNSKNDPYEVLLRHRAEFDRLLERYPGLEKILYNIQNSTLPPPDDPSANGGVPSSILQQTGGVSGYVNPTNSSSRYGKPPKPQQQQREIWTGEVGLRKGVEALKKARTNPGPLGDGVREFCELVTYLLNNPTLRQGQGGDDATSLVRREVVADQTRVIQTLLEVEKDGDDL